VNTGDSPHQVEQLSARLGLALPVLFDREGAAAAAWGVRVFPTTYLVGRDGLIRHRILGPLAWDGEEGSELLESVLGPAVLE
jgi:peroxiredoxin